MIDYTAAISKARPGAEFSLDSNDLSTLKWYKDGEGGGPPSEAEMEAAWETIQARKEWPTKGAFWNEFHPEEKQAITTSSEASIKYLLTELQMWEGPVWSDDARVIGGLDAVQAIGAIDQKRREEILAK